MKETIDVEHMIQPCSAYDSKSFSVQMMSSMSSSASSFALFVINARFLRSNTTVGPSPKTSIDTDDVPHLTWNDGCCLLRFVIVHCRAANVDIIPINAIALGT